MQNKKSQSELTKAENIKLIFDFWHRSAMHHAIWFSQVQKHLGTKVAFEKLSKVYSTSYEIQMKRIAKVLGFELEEGVPSPLLELADEKIEELKNAVAVNWLANDGVWFQAVEFEHGMSSAKICNDNSWAEFSPVEAWSIKKLLGLPASPGLEGLKKALMFRVYATINIQSIVEETESSFIFQMNECRVQSARKRKGLDDYPCKSGGIVEHTTFASAIDKRIKTECVCCPPDKHPDEYYCAWKFSI